MSSQPNGQLDRELNLKALIVFAIGLTAVVLAMAALMWFLSGALRERLVSQDPPRPRLPAARTQPLPPGPLLQTDPEEELRQMLDEEDELLSTFEWVDEASGVARVPIETAIDILAREEAQQPDAPESPEATP